MPRPRRIYVGYRCPKCGSRLYHHRWDGRNSLRCTGRYCTYWVNVPSHEPTMQRLIRIQREQAQATIQAVVRTNRRIYAEQR